VAFSGVPDPNGGCGSYSMASGIQRKCHVSSDHEDGTLTSETRMAPVDGSAGDDVFKAVVVGHDDSEG
jgi:hypothetical protein